MTVLVVAALSARMLAEAAADDGYEVVALDVFGDADTRAACSQWHSIGAAGTLRIDAERLLSVLGGLAARADVIGWIIGSGFEGRADLLERAAAVLPLIGTGAEAVRRVRDPRSFFAVLAGAGIAHPAVRMTSLPPGVGWLVKDAHGCGGWHIRRLGGAQDEAPLTAEAAPRAFEDAPPISDVAPRASKSALPMPDVAPRASKSALPMPDVAPRASKSALPMPDAAPRVSEDAVPMPGDGHDDGHRYFQREIPGTPMSATFVANGTGARVLGFNEMIVRSLGARPFVHHGVIGPLPLPPALASRIEAVASTLAAAFSLRGLGSLDFIREGDEFGVLEINPRVPASVALYGKRFGRRLSRGAAPAAPHAAGFERDPVRGPAHNAHKERQDPRADPRRPHDAGFEPVAAHVRACRDGVLPQARRYGAGEPSGEPVHGTEIVFARRALSLDEPAARRLAERAGCHDLPSGASRFAPGDPVCSVSASGVNAAQVRTRLEHLCAAVHRSLETEP